MWKMGMQNSAKPSECAVEGGLPMPKPPKAMPPLRNARDPPKSRTNEERKGQV